MSCCGTPLQAINLQAEGSLELLRCTRCGSQTWARDGVPIERDAAFAVLADAFRGTSVQVRATRERVAQQTAERAAQRQAVATRASADLLAGVSGKRLLPAGWQVLGATA